MSNEATIEQMNEVIARFMGYRFYDRDLTRRVVVDNNKDSIPVSELEYHTSWNALMTVGKKIHDLLNEMQKKRPPHTACHGDLIEVDIQCAVSYYDLGNAHKHMFTFITWYNECQQKQSNEQSTD